MLFCGGLCSSQSVHCHLKKKKKESYLPLKCHWFWVWKYCVWWVKDILYSPPAFDWVTISADAKLQLNEPSGWEKAQLQGIDSMHGELTIRMCLTKAKSSEKEKVAKQQMHQHRKQAKGDDNVLAWALAAPTGCRHCKLTCSVMLAVAHFDAHRVIANNLPCERKCILCNSQKDIL